MSQRPRTLNAWKHGGYSNLGVLPGEDPREFERLHQSLIDEWEPSGPTEHDAVLSIAKCLWRKSRLTVYAQAEVRKHLAVDFNDPLQAAWDAYDEQSRKAAQLPLSDELKRALKLESKDRAKQQIKQQLAEFDEQQVTPESLVKEIELEGRLDARIDRLVKRLFQLKAGKQMLGLGSRSHDAPSQARKLPLVIEQGTTVGQVAVDVGPACAAIGCNAARRRSRALVPAPPRLL
jgi:hypothetical protein